MPESPFGEMHLKLVALFAAVGLLALGCGKPLALKQDKPAGISKLEPTIAQPSAPLLPALPVSGPVLIKSARILTAVKDAPVIDNGWIRFNAGRIVDLGSGDAPSALDGEQIIEAAGKFITPGLIDTHSHLGVYASPGVWAHADGNEMTNPITAGIRAEEAFWPQDPGIQRAVSGGVTTIQVLPGSGNLMGGQTVVLKLRPRRETKAMLFPGAPTGIKMACGENPKRVYGKGRKSMPMSRMGSIYLMRKKWIEARRYRHTWANWQKQPTRKKNGVDEPITPPKRDLVLETLARVLDGDILVHIHCYRADEMLLQLQLANEFGFKVRSFHHAVEAYKIRDVLAREKVSVSTWADWWGFKIEAYDAIEQNLALLAESNAIGILHTDSAEGIQRMNQEAAKAYYAGKHLGVDVSENEALRWITANAAWALGIQKETGTLEKGKMADIVIWDRHPFSVYASAERVFIDGEEVYQAGKPAEPWSDLEVGQ